MTAVKCADQQMTGINSPLACAQVVLDYFKLFNLGQYQQVASLFAEGGHLLPPFESPVVGREKIARYLTQEADGMTIAVTTAQTQRLEDGCSKVDVRGKVTAIVFQVNVAWQFILTPDQAIESVKVDLLATLEELFKIRPSD